MPTNLTLEEEKHALGQSLSNVLGPRDASYSSLGLQTAPVDRSAPRQANISKKKQEHALGKSLTDALGSGRRRRKTMKRRGGLRKSRRRLR